MEEFELPQLTKLQTNIPKAEDIQWCGFLEQYDEQYDRITSRTEKRLQASLRKRATGFMYVCVYVCIMGINRVMQTLLFTARTRRCEDES